MTAPTPVPRRGRAASGADLRGYARLAVDAVVGVTGVVEAMHAAIAGRAAPLGAPGPARTRGLTGFVYGAVRGTTRAVGTALDAALRAVPPPDAAAAAGARSPGREALVAAINGVWGDHLVATGNPLAIPMTLRADGASIDPATARVPGPRLLLMVHGLCMNDLQWRRNGHDHGEALARDAGWTVLRLHYDSGRHVADNGRELAALLERVVGERAGPRATLAIVGHSMGGLVARSACEAGAQAGHRWPASLSTLVFLGTPHHGAPLERGGHLVGRVLGVSPYLAPFARLGHARSAGITDLRHGAVRDGDGGGPDRHRHARDVRVPTPLPRGVRAFAVAATTAARADASLGALVGDGLVPVASALGDHPDPRRRLGIPAARRYVATGASHWDLLDRADVYARLREWLARPAPGRRRVSRPAPDAAR